MRQPAVERHRARLCVCAFSRACCELFSINRQVDCVACPSEPRLLLRVLAHSTSLAATRGKLYGRFGFASDAGHAPHEFRREAHRAEHARAGLHTARARGGRIGGAQGPRLQACAEPGVLRSEIAGLWPRKEAPCGTAPMSTSLSCRTSAELQRFY